MLLSVQLKRKRIYIVVIMATVMTVLQSCNYFSSGFQTNASEVKTENPCPSTANSSNTLSVSDDNNAEIVTLEPGNTLAVRLSSNPGTGYSWQLAKNNTNLLEILGNPTLEPLPTESAANGSIYQVFPFVAQTATSSVLELQYGQGGETNASSVKTYRLNLTASDSPTTVTATEADNNGEVTAAPGDILVVRLKTNPGAGYSWQAIGNDPNKLKPLDNSIVEEQSQTELGGATYQVFRFEVKSEGTSILELQYEGSGETTPKETYRIAVRTLEETQTVRLTESDNNKEVRVIPGNTLILRLRADPDAGQTWQVVQNNVEELQPLENPLLEGTGNQYNNFCFQAKSAGSSTLEFHYSRPWEKDRPPLNIYRLNVQIR